MFKHNNLAPASDMNVKSVLPIENEVYRVVLHSEGLPFQQNTYTVPWNTFLPLNKTDTYKVKPFFTISGTTDTTDETILHISIDIANANSYTNRNNGRNVIGSCMISTGEQMAQVTKTNSVEFIMKSPNDNVTVSVYDEYFRNTFVTLDADNYNYILYLEIHPIF